MTPERKPYPGCLFKELQMNKILAPVRIQMTIQSRLDHVALVGKSVWALCRHADFSETEADGIELCLVEVVTNAIRHGCREEEGQSVGIDVVLFSDRISLVVSHGGQGPPHPPIDRFEADPADACPLSESGRGLAIVQRVMDRVAYDTDGRVHMWTMEKYRSDEKKTDPKCS